MWARLVGLDSAGDHRLTRWVFLRLLGVVYLVAFASLAVQVEGLIGPTGISPAGDYLAAMAERLGGEAHHLLPTLLWLGASDAALRALTWGGAALSLLVVAGVAEVPALAVLFVFYLSLTVAGQEFLSFQWDILLLETGFLAIFLAPMKLLPRRPAAEAAPSRLVLWLYRWLCFRLMWGSGVVKLRSGDPTWWDLTALHYHFETQPLPTVLGWWAHQLPDALLRAATVALFAIELVVPLLIFTTRRLRAVAAACFLFLMLVIALTGNYTFFNLLTAAIALLLVDDAAWPQALRRRLLDGASTAGTVSRRLPLAATLPVLGLVAALTLVPALGLFRIHPGPLLGLYRIFAPYHLTGSYGLFAVMTTRRAEIVIEGSEDGVTWQAYEFRYKPGEVTRRPRFAAPHQPRLDWQMWFAALGDYRQNPWLVNLCIRLLEGEPRVLALLETNPFPAAPPRYVRAETYDYRFTDIATRSRTGAWWRREPSGEYLPPISLREPR